MKLRLAHISDTHLGFQDLDCVNTDGVNVREADVYAAWHEAIDLIIKEKPDVMVHSGDFFHRPCPSNRALIQGLAGLKRLSEAGIPSVIIAGNHSTPRTVYTSPILQSFRSLDLVYPIFQETYEQVTIGDAVFHGVPHINDEERALEQLKRAKPVSGKINILLLHTSVGADYLMEEYGERVLPKEMSALLNDFSYTALGHFHSMRQIGKNARAWYSGSTERFTEKDAGKEKGFLFVTVEDDKNPGTRFVSLSPRPWSSLVVESCGDKTADGILEEIGGFAKSGKHADAIVSVLLSDLKPAQSLCLPGNEIAAMFQGALSVRTRRVFREEQFSFEHRDIRKESLLELFSDYADKNADTGEEAKELLGYAIKYFALADQPENADSGSGS